MGLISNTNQNHNEIYLPPVRVAIILKRQEIISIDDNVEKGNTVHSWSACKLAQLLWKTV